MLECVISKLMVFAASNVGSIDHRSSLMDILSSISEDDLKFVSEEILLDSQRCQKVLLEVILDKHERKVSSLDQLNSLPLFQTEKVIWDTDLVPDFEPSTSAEYFHAIPKLNLQFLTLLDYLRRNFILFRLESTYEIRQDLEAAITRMKPVYCNAGNITRCIFNGWSRMALPLQSFTVVEVKSPLIGERCPSSVKADFEVSLNIRADVKLEWEALRRHDVCFLVCISGFKTEDTIESSSGNFVQQYGIRYVRGCEIDGVLDADGKVIEEGYGNEVSPSTSTKRTFRVWLDPNQYYEDSNSAEDDDVYESFNVVIRRKPKENNFKAVLETIRSLMNTKFVVPSWLNDLILGYGDPSSASYQNLSFNDTSRKQDWHDTFVDRHHLLLSFPGYNIYFENVPDCGPPYRLIIDDKVKTVRAESYLSPIPGPYTQLPLGNSIRFTVAQVQAIRSGMFPGLTMIVGPPGTGKTDVAVQIIANIYRNHPEQRTLVVAHSNQALNQLFEKIIKLNVDQVHLLRLGHGERELETNHDFSRYGRVNL